MSFLVKVIALCVSTIIEGKIEVIDDIPGVNFIKNCLEEINKKYFKESGLIVLMNYIYMFDDMNFDSFAVRRIRSYFNLVTTLPFDPAPDVYILIIDSNNIESILHHLQLTSTWNPRAKFIVILQYKIPSTLFKTLQEMYVLDVIIFLYAKMEEVLIVSYFPYTSKRPGVLDKCIEGKLQNHQELFPSKLPIKWDDTTAVIGAGDLAPFVTYHREIGKINGFEIEILMLIRKKLNFKIYYVLQDEYESCNDTECWISYEKLLEHGIDIALSFQRNPLGYFDQGFSFLEEPLNWIVPTTRFSLKWDRYAKIFDLYIWLSLITVFPTILVLYYRAIQAKDSKKYQRLSYCLEITYRCFLGHGVNVFPKKSIVRIIFIMWVMFAILIGTAFQSKLVADCYDNEDHISSVKRLIKSDLKLCFQSVYTYFLKDRNNEKDSYILNHFEKCNYIPGLNRVAYHRDFATFVPRSYTLWLISNVYYNKNNKSLFYFLKDEGFTIPIYMLFRRGFPLFETINKLVINLKENGIVEHICDMMETNAKKAIQKAISSELGTHVITFNEVQGAFWLLILGLLISLFAFLCETRCLLRVVKLCKRLKP